MTARRVVGVETEYGITLPSDPRADPIHLSGVIVRAYADSAGPMGALPQGAGWDYADEAPLRDARGYEMARELADVSQLTDVDDPTLANSVLSNGARLYVDHAHPEYSSPEVSNPLDAVRFDRAGELVMQRAADASAAVLGAGAGAIRLYKNNVDGKGASYGTHDNYLLDRSVPFAQVVSGLLPFLVARPLICGAGRVGIGPASEHAGYQIAARADYIETEVGLETTLRRPLVNTRDEPHATATRYRRLHLISGDATLADVGGLLKIGTTSLVLRLIESGLAPRIELHKPVEAVRALSRDYTLRTRVPTRGGAELSGLDIVRTYLEAAQSAYAQERAGWERDDDTDLVLTEWARLVDDLGRDPMSAADRVDWVAKLGLLRAYRDRGGLAWDDPRLALIDIQYSDIDPSRGLALRMRAAGRLRSLVDDDAVCRAVTHAPDDTRAWFRGECVRRFGSAIRAASWDSVVFARPDRGVSRISLPDPLQATKAQTEGLFDAADSIDEFLDSLKAHDRSAAGEHRG
ncbi:MAG: depupylase/deamidase Dop [Ornithinimicrobium sp.]